MSNCTKRPQVLNFYLSRRYIFIQQIERGTVRGMVQYQTKQYVRKCVDVHNFGRQSALEYKIKVIFVPVTLPIKTNNELNYKKDLNLKISEVPKLILQIKQTKDSDQLVFSSNPC